MGMKITFDIQRLPSFTDTIIELKVRTSNDVNSENIVNLLSSIINQK